MTGDISVTWESKCFSEIRQLVNALNESGFIPEKPITIDTTRFNTTVELTQTALDQLDSECIHFYFVITNQPVGKNQELYDTFDKKIAAFKKYSKALAAFKQYIDNLTNIQKQINSNREPGSGYLYNESVMLNARLQPIRVIYDGIINRWSKIVETMNKQILDTSENQQDKEQSTGGKRKFKNKQSRKRKSKKNLRKSNKRR